MHWCFNLKYIYIFPVVCFSIKVQGSFVIDFLWSIWFSTYVIQTSSRRRHRSYKAGTKRLKNSYYPLAFRLLNAAVLIHKMNVRRFMFKNFLILQLCAGNIILKIWSPKTKNKKYEWYNPHPVIASVFSS